jgi:hypothetical protein
MLFVKPITSAKWGERKPVGNSASEQIPGCVVVFWGNLHADEAKGADAQAESLRQIFVRQEHCETRRPQPAGNQIRLCQRAARHQRHQILLPVLRRKRGKSKFRPCGFRRRSRRRQWRLIGTLERRVVNGAPHRVVRILGAAIGTFLHWNLCAGLPPPDDEPVASAAAAPVA